MTPFILSYLYGYILGTEVPESTFFDILPTWIQLSFPLFRSPLQGALLIYIPLYSGCYTPAAAGEIRLALAKSARGGRAFFLLTIDFSELFDTIEKSPCGV